jgi:pheromone shutdown protein TraB
VIELRASLTSALKDFGPQAIAIELDPDRLATLLEKAKGAKGEKPRDVPMFLRLWGHLQERLAADMGELPGSEMLVALDIARELKVPLFLVDDPMRQIAPRLLNSLSPKERVRLLVSSVFAFLTPSRIVKKELEHYSEHREEYVDAMRQQFPTVARVLLDERNVHMAERLKILSEKFERVAVVIGDAHAGGIESLLKDERQVKVSHLVEGQEASTKGTASAAP